MSASPDLARPTRTAPGLARGRRRAVRVGPWFTVVEPRVLLVCGGLALAAVLLLGLSLSLGDFPVPLSEVAPAALGHGSDQAGFIVRTLRLPRALTGALVGAAFGLSGAIFQRLTRNALASPDIIGITAGASAGAVLVIVLASAGHVGVTAGALGGGLLAAIVIYALAWNKGITGYRLVLVGIGITAALTSVIQFLLTRAEITEASQATVWLTGSLNGRGWNHVVPVGVAVLLLGPMALGAGRSLRILQLGDDAARGLGVRVDAARTWLILAAVGLAAVATASAGPIAFVALAAPPIAKRMGATGGLALVPAALVGACVVLAADLVAQHLMGGLPVGVATALVGAPYLLLLLSRANRIGSDG